MSLKGLLLLGTVAFAVALPRGAEVLVELDQKPMGNALLSTVHLQLEADTPVEEILELLESIALDLQQQQEQADIKHNNDVDYCREMTEFYQANIDDAKNSINYNTDALQRDRPALVDVNTEISNTEGQLAAHKDSREKAKERREQDHELFLEYNEEFEDSVSACDEAIEIVRDLKYEQKSTNIIAIQLENIQTRITKSMSQHQRSLYGPSIAALVQVAVKADQNTVDRIIELLTDLRDDLALAQEEDKKAEDSAQAAWEQYDIDIAETIQKTQDALDRLNQEKSRLQDSIKLAEELLAQAEEKKANNEVLLDNQNKQCNDWEEIYKRETKER